MVRAFNKVVMMELINKFSFYSSKNNFFGFNSIK